MHRALALLLTPAVLAIAVQAGTSSTARADDGAQPAATVWAPYVVVGDTTVEIVNAGDAPTWPRLEVTLHVLDHSLPNCYGFLCTYGIQAPEIDAGHSWTLDLADRACSAGLPATICLPDGAIGGLKIEAALVTGTGANAGATTADPNGSISVSVTTAVGTYDASVPSSEVTLSDVGRRSAVAEGASTVLRLMGAGAVVVDWYRDDDLVVEQRLQLGSYCCGETGYFRTSTRSIDPRDVDGLDDDTVYTVVVTAVDTSPFAVVTTDAPETP